VQNTSAITAESSTQISFVFNPSGIVYQTTVSNKTSEAQFLFSILATIVSLFSVFAILFKGTEFAMRKLNVSLVDVAAGAGVVPGTKETAAATSQSVDMGAIEMSPLPKQKPSPGAMPDLQELQAELTALRSRQEQLQLQMNKMMEDAPAPEVSEFHASDSLPHHADADGEPYEQHILQQDINSEDHNSQHKQ
jgi:hypothetical protein